MKYTLTINQMQALEAGITNVNQAHILDLLTSCSTWAAPEQHNGEVYYWVSRQLITRELPILKLKPDTVYRHLKALAALNLIDYQKKGKKDLVKLTSKGKKYYVGNKSESLPSSYVGNKSEKQPDSEKNPCKFGNKSENTSETFPTDPTTKEIRNTNDQAAVKKHYRSDQRFAMHEAWKPGLEFEGICHRGGLSDPDEVNSSEVLSEFILFWEGQPSEQTQYNWELKFMKHLKRLKSSTPQSLKQGGTHEQQINLDSTRW